MDPAEPALIKDLFQAAADLDGPARDEFLARRCAGRADLHREVLSLLAADGAGPFLEPGASAAEAPCPDRIGDFKIHRRIAEGGMGTVFEADQESPQRRVALKVLRSGLFSGEAMRRFEYEIRALAQLVHPGIARIYESGAVAVGGIRLPYFAMELIEGGSPITRHARDHDLGRRAALALFLEVCDAVHAAHQRGIIHRDLKPSNILVDADGRPRIIDFGIARAVEPDQDPQTRATLAGALIGTLPYMSPEQCGPGGDADTRSDVYALGVVLYELLAKRPPHDIAGLGIVEAARIVREASPGPPSAADRSLRGDLDTIILKALEKDPARRYQSVAALADDLRRFLGGQPIEARRGSALYTLGKAVRRHLLAASLVAAIVLVLAGAAAAGWALTLRATRAEARAVREGETARRISDFYSGLLLRMDPWSEGGMAAGTSPAEMRLPDLLRAGIRRIPATFQDRPDLAADLQRSIGRAMNGLALPAEAERIFRESARSAAASLGPDHPLTLELRRNLGNSLVNRGASAEGVAILRDVAERTSRTLGERDTRSILALLSLNWALHDSPDTLESDALSRRVVEVAERALPEADPLRTEALTQRAIVLIFHRRFDEAEQAASKAVALARGIGEGRSIYLALALDARQAALVHLHRWRDALDVVDECLRIRRTTDGENHLNYIRSANTQIPLARLGRCDEAIARGRQVYDQMRSAQGDGSAETVQALVSLLFTMVHCGRAQDAHDLAVARLRELAPDQPGAGAIKLAAAVALDALDRPEEADRALMPLLDQPPTPGPFDYAIRWEPECYPLVARGLIRQRRFEEAEWRLLDARDESLAEGDRARGERVAAELESLHRAWGAPRGGGGAGREPDAARPSNGP